VTPAPQLRLTAIPGLPLVKKNDDVGDLILAGLSNAGIALRDEDVLVIAQKVISKAEGRTVRLSEVTPSEEAQEISTATDKDPRLVELILKESERILRMRPGLIIVEHRLGFICANAGIDSSNVSSSEEGGKDEVLLLPEDPDLSARRLRDELLHQANVNIGILVIDSHGRPWREGSVGVALGVAGMPALLDFRGQPDLFGDLLVSTQVGVADELASAASILMGQAAEGYPVVHARGLPYSLREGSIKDLIRAKEKDLFRS
jgi:coenzyme F420-0:L-glutamate ligase/coenzyme F420-1:gamma-L-glutamate ligase